MIPTILLYSFFSGITVFLGGLLARLFETQRLDGTVREEILLTSTAVGGGILVAAVAFVLVPEGMAPLPAWAIVVIFLAGGAVFFGIDKALQSSGGSYAQLLAMLMDFVPEALALGAVFASDHRLGLLIAIFIGLQNLPESFNSYRDLKESGWNTGKTLAVLFALSFSGVVAALLGYLVLRDAELVKASMMLFSAGGIVYLIFQDIAPESKGKNLWTPALGATVGFAIGMVGQKLLG